MVCIMLASLFQPSGEVGTDLPSWSSFPLPSQIDLYIGIVRFYTYVSLCTVPRVSVQVGRYKGAKVVFSVVSYFEAIPIIPIRVPVRIPNDPRFSPHAGFNRVNTSSAASERETKKPKLPRSDTSCIDPLARTKYIGDTYSTYSTVGLELGKTPGTPSSQEDHRRDH